MKSIVRWAINNSPAMNILMIAVLGLGGLAGMMLKREVFPRFELEIILVTVPYPGASPDEVENGICLKIEEAIRSVDGIKKITSVAAEGAGNVVIEVATDGPPVSKVLNDVESEVDQIPSFPDLAERVEIKQLTLRAPAIKVGVVGPDVNTIDAELQLREITENVRDELLQIKEVSLADIQPEKQYQIDIEVPEKVLREYGLTLSTVATRIRQQNLELPGGKVKSESGEFNIRAKNKENIGERIAKIPIVTNETGVALTVDDIGRVKDEFADQTAISRINGKPGLAISIEASEREDLLAMTDAVRKYVKKKQLPPGYSFEIWDDKSVDVKDRLDLLIRNGGQGLILVFIVLALFLEFRLSFWVALGIPISVLGACIILMLCGQTMNMLSMFAFLIALGIVVDDAIVVGENIYAHRHMGKSFFRAAIDGTAEVMPSVAASVTTTIIAFMPMFFVTGVMGKFFAVMPLAVIAMLAISLVEAAFILPCHLAHGSKEDEAANAKHDDDETSVEMQRQDREAGAMVWIFEPLINGFLALCLPVTNWINARMQTALEFVVNRIYTPAIKTCLAFPAITFATATAVLLVSFGLVTNGMVPWVFFPKLDARSIASTVIFPDGTPSRITDEATKKLEDAIWQLNEKYKPMHDGNDIVELTHRLVGQVRAQAPGGQQSLTEGGHAGMVQVELVDNQNRKVTSQQISQEWRAMAGNIPGYETLTFGTQSMGPGGNPIEFKLLASGDHMPELEAAVEECKVKLETYAGVFDTADDSRPGKWELQITVKDDAESLGVPLQTIANTVRSSYYGDEVMRLQRGRHEVKLMVRYPSEERRSMADFGELRVNTGDGKLRPIKELANVQLERSYSEINRIDQKRSITITSDVNEKEAVASEIIADMKKNFIPELLKKYPQVSVRWEGQAEQSQESIGSLFIGFVVALIAMFALLTLEFRSYIQPIIIMTVIPFSAVGALWGHAFMGLPLTLFSVLGMVALTGVVVNDSIVLIDFVNHRLAEGMPLKQALIFSGQRRFRPVLLTSLTTIAGLLPILSEKSFQAQLLIPMATSLCFGLMLATILVLILAPTFYLVYGKVVLGLPMGEMPDEAQSEFHFEDDEPAPSSAEVPIVKETEHEPAGVG